MYLWCKATEVCILWCKATVCGCGVKLQRCVSTMIASGPVGGWVNGIHRGNAGVAPAPSPALDLAQQQAQEKVRLSRHCVRKSKIISSQCEKK